MTEMQDILKLRFYFSFLGLIMDNLIYSNKFGLVKMVWQFTQKDFLVSQTFFKFLPSLILQNYETIVFFLVGSST